MKRILILLAGIGVIGLIVGLIIYNKPHKNIGKSKADFTLTSQELFAAFESNEAVANEKYLDKVIAVSGKVTASSTDEDGLTSITLDGGGMMFGVICKLDALTAHARNDFSPGEDITLKGVCSGMLMDVVLVRCVEI